MGIVASFEKSLVFWAEAALAMGKATPSMVQVVVEEGKGHGVQATEPIAPGTVVTNYLLTGLAYIHRREAVVGRGRKLLVDVCAFDLPVVEVCGSAVQGWSRLAHVRDWAEHDTRINMGIEETSKHVGIALTDATAGCSSDIDEQARQFLEQNNMAGVFCNHSEDANAMIVWQLVEAEDSEQAAYVPTIVSRRRIAVGDYVHVNYGSRYKKDRFGRK